MTLDRRQSWKRCLKISHIFVNMHQKQAYMPSAYKGGQIYENKDGEMCKSSNLMGEITYIRVQNHHYVICKIECIPQIFSAGKHFKIR